MQKRIDAKTGSDTHSTSLRSAIRPVASETPSEASSFRTDQLDPLASFEFGVARNKQLSKMTQSQKPIFSKINTRLIDIKTGLDIIQRIFERRQVEGIKAVFLTSQRMRKQRRPSALSQNLQDVIARSQMQQRDLIKRNPKADQLLSSLPIKFKKKMNSMIDDYEKERVQLIIRVKQMQCSSNELDYSNQLFLKIKEVYTLCNPTQILQNYIDQIDLIKNTILNLHRKIQSLEQEATQRQRANTQPQFNFESEKGTNECEASELKSLTKLLPYFKETENQLNKYLMIPMTSQSIPRIANQSERSHSTSQSKINRSMARSSVKGKSKKLSSENTSEHESGEEQFGKEKVIEKKRMRRLFRAFLSSQGYSKKEAFQDLANQIGLKKTQCDSYSNLLC